MERWPSTLLGHALAPGGNQMKYWCFTCQDDHYASGSLWCHSCRLYHDHACIQIPAPPDNRMGDLNTLPLGAMIWQSFEEAEIEMKAWQGILDAAKQSRQIKP